MEARSLPLEQAPASLMDVMGQQANRTAPKDKAKLSVASTPLVDTTRAELGPSSTAASQRDRMLTSSQQLERTNDILQHSKEQLQQTEAIGVLMLKGLQGQRQTIQRARHTLSGASNQLQQAEAAVKSMEQRKWFGIF
ncbi:hypothetical protein V8C86DRAFT_2679306 [Haematococcus lacustris]